jgi:hypothetical protein
MDKATDKFLQDRALYEEAVRQHVCLHCIDFGEDGVCHSLDPKGCAIFRYLPELVDIARRVNERTLQPYVDAVRSGVCMKCRSGTPGDPCPLRDTMDCGLDRYLPLVLEAIEEVNATQEKERKQWRQL